MEYRVIGTAEMQQRIAEVDVRERQGALTQEDFIEAVTVWTETRRVSEALSRDEIGGMRAFDRLDALRKSMILGLSLYYKDNPRADVAPGVLAIITIMSDNDRGECQLSQATLAELLHRSRTAIAEAVVRLKASKLMHSDKGRAGANPVVPRVLSTQYNHVVWLVNALKPVPSTGQVRSSTCPVKPTGNLSRLRDMSEKPVPSSRQVENEPVPSTGHNFTSNRSLPLYRMDSPHSLSDLQDCKSDCACAEEASQPDLLENVNGQAIAEAAAKAVKPKRAKKAKTKNGRPEYTDAFNEFWFAYPRHANMSKAKAFDQWNMLDDEDREWATKAAAAYCAQQERKAQKEGLTPDEIAHKTKHADGFLKDRRFDAYRDHVEGKQAAATAQPEQTFGGMPRSRVIDLVADFFRHGASRWSARIAETLGVPPGAEGCGIPEDIIAAGRMAAGA